MRNVLLGVLIAVILAFASVGQVHADGGLTSAVAAAYFPRTLDATLHDIAHQRVAELMRCRCLEHDRMRAGTAEVLAWNDGVASPIASAIAAWSGSALHRGILSNASYGRIGCAEAVDGSVHWFACVLAAGPLPAGGTVAAVAAPVVTALPDTALEPRPADRPIPGGVAPI
jgi:hypothetical protein